MRAVGCLQGGRVLLSSPETHLSQVASTTYNKTAEQGSKRAGVTFQSMGLIQGAMCSLP